MACVTSDTSAMYSPSDRPLPPNSPLHLCVSAGGSSKIHLPYITFGKRMSKLDKANLCLINQLFSLLATYIAQQNLIEKLNSDLTNQLSSLLTVSYKTQNVINILQAKEEILIKDLSKCSSLRHIAFHDELSSIREELLSNKESQASLVEKLQEQRAWTEVVKGKGSKPPPIVLSIVKEIF